MELSRRVQIAAAAVSAATCLTFIAACGSEPAPGLATTAYSARHSGPPQGSRAASLALGRKMLRQLRRPPGSRVVRPHPVPQNLRGPAQGIAATRYVDVKRFFAAPRSMRASYAYLRRHAPVGYRLDGSGSMSQGGRTVLEFVAYQPRSVPRGVDEADLIVGVVPGRHGGSVLRADGQVTWFPPRSAAEHLRPAAYRAVTITRSPPGGGHQTVRTFRSRAVITRLARILNSLPASDGGSVSCPPNAPTYRLVFRPAAGRPRFAATSFYCLTDPVTVGGRRQPDLADPANRVAGAAQRLLRARGH
jgi:hypothetical protein